MRTLLFGTTYVDTLEKRAVQRMWFDAAARNPVCDAMIVDSQSPMMPHVPLRVHYYTFADNVGHLSRNGRDGRGRAFCYGLQYAVDHDYDWVAHVECDSVCKLDVAQVAAMLGETRTSVATIPLSSWAGHIETGFMFFDVEWLRDSSLVERYDWAHRQQYPEPEKVVNEMCGRDLHLMNYRGMRDDFHELTVDNVLDRNLDWLTHADVKVMEKFACV